MAGNEGINPALRAVHQACLATRVFRCSRLQHLWQLALLHLAMFGNPSLSLLPAFEVVLGDLSEPKNLLPNNSLPWQSTRPGGQRAT